MVREALELQFPQLDSSDCSLALHKKSNSFSSAIKGSIVNRDWLQLASNLAIIIGLIVVVFEMKQSHEIARTQLINDDYLSLREHLHTIMGENAADAIAKAKTAPDETHRRGKNRCRCSPPYRLLSSCVLRIHL